MLNVEFEGATGLIKFGSEEGNRGDRVEGLAYDLLNYQSGIGVVPIGYWDTLSGYTATAEPQYPTSDNSKPFDHVIPECTEDYWGQTVEWMQISFFWNWAEGDTPTCEGGAELPEPLVIPGDHILKGSTIGVLMQCLGAAGLLISFTFLAGTIRYRRSKAIINAQPLFCALQIVGAMMLCIEPFLLVGPLTRARCSASLWIEQIGVDIMLGALVLKVWRVFKILENAQRMKRTRVTASTTLMGLGVLVGMKVVLMAINEILSNGLATHEMVYPPARPIDVIVCPEVHPSLDGMILMHRLNLVLAACYISYATRNISRSLVDGHAMFLAVLNLVAWDSFRELVENIPGTPLLVAGLVRAISAVMGSIIALGVILGPKLFSEYKSGGVISPVESDDVENSVVASSFVEKMPESRSTGPKKGGASLPPPVQINAAPPIKH
ncbi:unnamed protein product [Chrysoparadoxa australica]